MWSHKDREPRLGIAAEYLKTDARVKMCRLNTQRGKEQGTENTQTLRQNFPQINVRHQVTVQELPEH